MKELATETQRTQRRDKPFHKALGEFGRLSQSVFSVPSAPLWQS
jgi:hypothetical protein